MFGIDDLAFGDVASAVGGVLGFVGQQNTNEMNQQNANNQMGFQERMSSTAYQRAVDDMKKAGLNPMLAYSQGGASTPIGSMPQIQNSFAAGTASAAQAAAMHQVVAQTEKTKAETANVAADTALKEAQVPAVQASTTASIASAGHAEALKDKVRQDIQAWIDVGRERAFIGRDNEWYGAAIRGYEKDVAGSTVDARIQQARAEATRLKTQAELLGLEVPGALNQAAFERSDLGKSSRAVDFSTGQVGRVVNSAARVVPHLK